MLNDMIIFAVFTNIHLFQLNLLTIRCFEVNPGPLVCNVNYNTVAIYF